MALVNAADLLKQVVTSTKELDNAMDSVAKGASDAYNPELFREIQKSVAESEAAKQELESTWRDIEDAIGGIRVFPNIRNDINETRNFANRRLSLLSKARFNAIVSTQEAGNIKDNADQVLDAANALETALQELAKISKNSFATDQAYQVALGTKRQEVEKLQIALAAAKNILRERSELTIASQLALDESSRAVMQNGTAGFFDAMQEASSSFIRGVKAAWSQDAETARKEFAKSAGTGKALRHLSKERIDQNAGSDFLGKGETALQKASTAFSSMVGGLSSLARNMTIALSLLGGFSSLISLLVEGSDRARELNKELLSGRSMGDLGLNLQAQADPRSVADAFSGMTSQFASIYANALSSDNKFKLSTEEAKSKLGELSGLYLPRISGNLNQGKNTIAELNKFVTMGMALSRQWGVSTSEIAQRNIELVNEYNYSYDQLKSLYGGLERITKGSYLSLPRLLGAIQGLSDQSPIFGNTLIQTASLYTKLYDTKLLGTKDIESYIQKLTQTFQDQDTTQRVMAELLKNKPDKALNILRQAVEATPPGSTQRQIAQQALEKAIKITQGGPMTAFDISELSFAISKTVPQAKQALLAEALLSEDQLQAKFTDRNFFTTISTTVAQLARSGQISGDQGFILELNKTILALARKNPTLTVRDILNQALEQAKSQANSDKAEYDKVEKDLIENAGALAPPLIGIKNGIDGILIKLSSFADSIVKFFQKLLVTPFVKWVSDKLGIGVPSSEQAKNRISDLLKVLEQKRIGIQDSSTSEANRKVLIDEFNKALTELSRLAAAHPEQAQAFKGRKQSIFQNYYQVVGQQAVPREVIALIEQNFGKSLLGFSSTDYPSASPISVTFVDPKRDYALTKAKKSDILKAGTRSSVKYRGLDIKMPRNFEKLTEVQQKILDRISQDPTSPKALLLAALHTKFGTSPLFAYILRHFLENAERMDTTELSNSVFNYVSSAYSSIVHVTTAFLKGDRENVEAALDVNRQEVLSTRRFFEGLFTTPAKPVDLPSRLPKVIQRVTSPAGAQKGIKATPQAQAQTAAPKPAPPPVQTSTTTQEIPPPAEITYQVRNINMRVVETRVDLASMVDSIVSSKLNNVRERLISAPPNPKPQPSTKSKSGGKP